MFKDFNFRSQRTLIFSALFFGFAGMIQLFEPVDLGVTALSNKIRMHDASGEIVIVSLDDYSTTNNITPPLRAEHANQILVDLLAAGADKVVFTDPVLLGNDLAGEKLQNTLQVETGNVFFVRPISADSKRDTVNKSRYISSDPAIHVHKETRFWGGVEYIYSTRSDSGEEILAAEFVLNKKHNLAKGKYRIDYAIDVESIPYVLYEPDKSAALSKIVNGKQVLVGLEKAANASTFRGLGQNGPYGKPSIVAVGAETLQKGKQFQLGWYWSLLFAIPFAYFALGSRKILLQGLGLAIFLCGSLIIVTALNTLGVFFSIGHALIFVFTANLIGVFRSLGRNSMLKNAVHPDSGLPALSALRLEPKNDQPLVLAEISGFDELMGILSPAERQKLADRISTLATSEEKIWHGENGQFYWFISNDQTNKLGRHLDSLALIMRNGFSIGSLPVSLQTVFGVDLRTDAAIPDRILGAKLSAKRAATTGQFWMAYEEEDKDETAWSIGRLRELDLAIDAGQIRADLQPKADLKTGGIVGVEALARWTHPIRGRIRPDEFIKAAEEGGRIKELTIAVMHSAFASVAPALSTNPNFSVSVNITPSLLEDPTLCSSVSSLLALHQIPTSNLILEVTESTAFSGSDKGIQCMHELVAMGVTLSIDDYGTGNSTLEYMRNIPARELKIDRTFVSHLLGSDEDKMLVRSTIQLAHRLNMLVVAEGVEDTQTLESLRSLGCDVVQGYLISKPLSPEHFFHYLQNLRGTSAIVNAR